MSADPELTARLFDVGWRRLMARYARYTLTFALPFGVCAAALLTVLGGDSLRTQGLGEGHLRTMLGLVLVALATIAFTSLWGAAMLWVGDRVQLRRMLRRLALEPDERLLGVASAFLGEERHPAIRRAETFGEYLVVTDARLLHLRFPPLGRRLIQATLCRRDEVAAVSAHDLRLDRAPASAWLLELLRLDRALTITTHAGARHVFIPEPPNLESLRAWLGELGLPLAPDEGLR